MPSNPDERGPGPDLDHLEALARAATPGPWERCGADIDGGPGGYEQVLTTELRGAAYAYHAIDMSDADYAHICAANPETMILLIERVRELEGQRNEALVAAMDMYDWSGSGITVERDHGIQMAMDRLEKQCPDWRSWATEGGDE